MFYGKLLHDILIVDPKCFVPLVDVGQSFLIL